jgi:hypothetical protein
MKPKLEPETIKLSPAGAERLEADIAAIAKPMLGAVYTENEVAELLQVQRGNCYCAILSKTRDEQLAKVAGSAPEPSGGKWRK